jgi:cytochrome P450
MTTAVTTKQRPPGPRPLPPLGGGLQLCRFMLNPLAVMGRLYQDYGPVVVLGGRSRPRAVFVFGADYNEAVLNDPVLFANFGHDKSPLRIPKGSALSRIFGGLTQMNGHQHRRHRGIMMPPLQRSRVESYASDIHELTKAQTAQWSVGQEIDLFREMKTLTLAVAVRCLLGLDPAGAGQRASELFEKWMRLVFSLSVVIAPFNLPGLPYSRLLRVSEELETLIASLIERKRAGEGNDRDVLSLLLKAQYENPAAMSTEEIIGETTFLFMAGHTTTASALTWTMFLLAQHPQFLAEVVEECCSTIRGDTLSAGDIERLTLLDAALKESLRLLPPVLWWARISTAPFNIGPYEFPEGIPIIHSAFYTHRMSDRYEEPMRFNPKRWSNLRPRPCEYIPFSAGPRMCLGAAFADMEMKIVLASILRQYRLSLPARVRVDVSGPMISAPKGGLRMTVEEPGRLGRAADVFGSIRSVVDMAPAAMTRAAVN